MKILIVSYSFYPSVGGIETVTEILAGEFVKKGHEVKVLTSVPGNDDKKFTFDVIRTPGQLDLFQAVKWCDLCFHNNISLEFSWPLFFLKRPWVVAHHTWIRSPNGNIRAVDRIKQFVLKFADNISISDVVDAHINAPTVVIPDPYNDDIFYDTGKNERIRDMVFVGRMVSDKGGELLIKALKLLKNDGFGAKLTMVGDGPEKPRMLDLARNLELEAQVDFVGIKKGAELREILNAHNIIVVPSLWKEPFGVVALEGMACGCVPVVAGDTGLVEAVGETGIVFKRGDVQDLAMAIKRLLGNSEKLRSLRRKAPDRLKSFTPGLVAGEYIKIFDRAIKYGRCS